jgi:hypothetical protein
MLKREVSVGRLDICVERRQAIGLGAKLRGFSGQTRYVSALKKACYRDGR